MTRFRMSAAARYGTSGHDRRVSKEPGACLAEDLEEVDDGQLQILVRVESLTSPSHPRLDPPCRLDDVDSRSRSLLTMALIRPTSGRAHAASVP